MLLLWLLFVVAIRPELLPIFQLRLVLLTLSMASETSLTALTEQSLWQSNKRTTFHLVLTPSCRPFPSSYLSLFLSLLNCLSDYPLGRCLTSLSGLVPGPRAPLRVPSLHTPLVSPLSPLQVCTCLYTYVAALCDRPWFAFRLIFKPVDLLFLSLLLFCWRAT